MTTEEQEVRSAGSPASGERPVPADLGPVSSDDLQLLDELAQEFLARYRKGERPRISEYASRIHGKGDQLGELLSALIMVEGLRPHVDDLEGRTGKGRAQGLARNHQRLGDYRIVRE